MPEERVHCMEHAEVLILVVMEEGQRRLRMKFLVIAIMS